NVFRNQLHQLSSMVGRHTECVSVYVPPYRQIHNVISYLSSEAAVSQNIKDGNNRKAVVASITRILE
ncbi:MAG TPA: peptide chain release factor 1, partial [Candidatus Lokiarchaeia archaeon]|nr:peptide chain release factor 1 [Candidatus Lokiarchaeia archaeon]